LVWIEGFAEIINQQPCSEIDNEIGCNVSYECGWEKETKKCIVKADTCRSLNEFIFDVDETINLAKKAARCEEKECWWKENSTGDGGTCRPVEGRCEGKTWSGCIVDSDCRWFDGNCMLRAAKQHEKAVQALDGICTEKNPKSGRNDFWIETIPSPCVLPVTNEEVQQLCEMNAEDLTPHGKKKCREAIAYVLGAGEAACLDASEMRYQKSLKDADAREQRRAEDAACRENTAQIYTGPVFSGGGLRGGAILAHENLTKSISHETDLKSVVLGWTKFILELVAIIAVLAIVWAGILYVTDMGDGGNLEKAKKILIWVAVGILVILGSYAIVNALMKADLGSSRAEIITSLDA
jgi:hypothetical protein